jgi:predicted transcriptional regulator
MAAKRRAESREGMVITTVALPPELHRRLAITALDENAALAEVIREAVRRYVDAHENRLAKSQSPRRSKS